MDGCGSLTARPRWQTNSGPDLQSESKGRSNTPSIWFVAGALECPNTLAGGHHSCPGGWVESTVREATRLDPGCASCYWGLSYVLGPNINSMMDASDLPEAWNALQKALEDRSHLDRAYAEAMGDSARLTSGRPLGAWG